MKYIALVLSKNSAHRVEPCLKSLKERGICGFGVDGGSTDGTLDLYEKYGFKYISGGERNLSHAINRAVEQTDGDIYSILGADDRWIGDHNILIDYFNKNKSEFVYAPIDLGHGKMGDKLVTYEEMLKGNKIPGISVFFRRHFLLKYPYSEEWNYANDYEQLLRIMADGHIPGHINHHLIHYNITGDNQGMSKMSAEEAEKLKKYYANRRTNNSL